MAETQHLLKTGAATDRLLAVTGLTKSIALDGRTFVVAQSERKTGTSGKPIKGRVVCGERRVRNAPQRR